MDSKEVVDREAYRKGLHALELGLKTTNEVSLNRTQEKRVYKFILFKI